MIFFFTKNPNLNSFFLWVGGWGGGRSVSGGGEVADVAREIKFFFLFFLRILFKKIFFCCFNLFGWGGGGGTVSDFFTKNPN